MIALHCKHLLRNCEAKRDIVIENSGICLRRRGKIWIAEAKFDKFCKRKFDKRRILFCAVFVDYICVYFIWSWMFTIIVDISATFWNLGFYDKSKPCIAIRPVIISRNYGSSLG